MSTTVVLASASPRRAELLQRAGIHVQQLPSHCCEDWNGDPHVEQYVQRIAYNKAQSGWQSWHALTSNKHQEKPVIVIAADTTVWRSSTNPLGKPVDRDDAYRMIQTLADGESHTVTTGYCILSSSGATTFRLAGNKKETLPFVREIPEEKSEQRPDKQLVSFESTRVWMNKLDDAAIARYLDQNEWSDKAGAYGIQGSAGCFVSRIEGSYTNVVGLPVAQVLQGLAEIGYVLAI